MTRTRSYDKHAPTDRSGHLYYVRLKTPIGVLYKLGYTKLDSVQSRLAFKGTGDGRLIDRVLCFVHLPDAYDVEQMLHGHFSEQLAFGKFSAIGDMPLFQNGQSELYCVDVLSFDNEFCVAGSEVAAERAKLAKYIAIWGSEETGRRMIQSHKSADTVGKVIGAIVAYTLVLPIAWLCAKVFKPPKQVAREQTSYEAHRVNVARTIERVRRAEAARHEKPA